MGILSFTAKQNKQKPKLFFKVKSLLLILLVILVLTVSAVTIFIIAVNNKEVINNINKPRFFVAPKIYLLIGLIIYAVTAPSLYFTYKYENNFKTLCALSCASLVLNIVYFVVLLILCNLAFSVLIILCNFVICCHYFKQLKSKALGTLLFIPYMVWLMFNIVLTYSVYLLN